MLNNFMMNFSVSETLKKVSVSESHRIKNVIQKKTKTGYVESTFK
jgi:hypothetical protein